MAYQPPAAGSPEAARLERIEQLAHSDFGQALDGARRALGEGLASPMLHHIVAVGLKDERRFEEAVAELGLGLQLEPDNAALMTEVGFCLLELGRRREAGQVFSAALKL